MFRELSNKCKSGFTLIELLVVVAIISILAGILFPVFARAREGARRASCQSNMKQIALASIMYTQDYDGALFPYKYDNDTNDNGSEMNVLFPYIKNAQVFRCPSSMESYGESHCINNPTHWYCSSYGFPAGIPDWNQSAALLNTSNSVTILDAVPLPSQTCLLAEIKMSYSWGQNLWGYTHFYAANLEDGSMDGIIVPDQHLGGSNYAFIDGHVKWLKRETALAPRLENQAIRFYWRTDENP